ncbi:Uncharacterized protein PCOAH_00046100 [Plasmodium coatneyi]|uniref:Uncharacterized protein n=1 Tax=Plasmodium coatneyi TaxID=208452 RepID=A0A1B1E4Z8_9APIC|nr:Uncharacterized protein PCOAH_00046100 [Plasmodium coatneyi]ANQ09859.1 Uncharacterized protein PCOAH_00046100 [Plasmodium coatneyi]
MFSLIKSVFSNGQEGKELNVLIIGECESGKTSLFNLIGSFHNKSKYDMLNTVIPTGNKNGTCALGFNTKKITFNRKPLKIYDLEGTATNTTNIYDCYYDDADVIFYVIDAKDEKHIFNAILYLSCLSSNGRLSRGGLPDGSNTCKKGRQFLKPIFILGNKSEDTSAFFSAPCISNYINSIDVYKNEKFWQFLLSSDNTFLKHYLSVLHHRVLNYAFADGVDEEQTDQREVKREGNKDGKNGDITENTPCDIVKDIKSGLKGAITVDDIENDPLLETLLKKIVSDNVNNCKRMPIQVYNISVLRNKGVYEVLEKIFDEYFLSGMYTNGGKVCNNTRPGKTEKRGEYANEHVPLNGRGRSDCTIQGETGRTGTHLIHVSGEGCGHTGKSSLHPRNCRTHNVEMTEHLHTAPNSAYVMYERNSTSVNLFIEHIQHLYFGKSTFDNVPKEFFFPHQGNAKYRKKYKIKKKDQLGGNGTAAGLQKGEATQQVKKTYDADDTYEEKETLCTDRTMSIDNTPLEDKGIPQDKSGEGVREHTKGQVKAVGVNAISGRDGTNAEVKREELDSETGEVSNRTKIEQKGEVIQVGQAAELIKGVMHPNGGEFIEDEADSEGKKSRDLFQSDKEESDQNYANHTHHTDYSSNEGTPKSGSPLCEENHINGHVNHGKNVMRKGKINKKKYFIVEKKKKKKFLHSGKKISDVEENSSNSLEGVNLMNVMRVDSLNKI